jgi:hypothetical protein
VNKVARMTKRDRAGRWITSPMASRATVISAGRDCRKPSAPLFSQLAPCLQSREAAVEAHFQCYEFGWASSATS